MHVRTHACVCVRARARDCHDLCMCVPMSMHACMHMHTRTLRDEEEKPSDRHDLSEWGPNVQLSAAQL